MKCAVKVLHVSNTPLVGAPGNIVKALNQHTGYSSEHIIANDYPGLLKGFYIDSIVYSEEQLTHDICSQLVEEADIIHVHNDLLPKLCDLILQYSKPTCKYIYQVHSPLREGPLFFDRSEFLGLPFSKKLTIVHYQNRIFKDFRFVPNIVYNTPHLTPLNEKENIQILFSPSHKRSGHRWGDKVSEKQNAVLKGIFNLDLANVLEVTGVRPSQLAAIRRRAHISIDEIVTGAFHQNSLEGLSAGNVVINNADYFAILGMQNVLETQDLPPFVSMNEQTIAEDLLELLNNRDRIRQIQIDGHRFFLNHLLPEKLIRVFTRIYEEVLDEN